MATVEVYLDNRPDGSEVRIPGLGIFENGTTTELDEDVWERYKAANPDEDYDDDHTFEFSTQAYEERAEAIRRLEEEEDLTDLKKDELVDVADTVGIPNADDMTKDELVEELE